jgi:hypothetical protein
MWAFIAFLVLSLAGVGVFVAAAILVADTTVDSTVNTSSTAKSDGAVVPPEINVAPPDDLNLAPGTSKINQKLYGYTMAQASLFTLAYMMQFYTASRVNFGGLESGENIVAPPDLDAIYGPAETQLRRSLKIRPVRKRVDMAARKYDEQLTQIKPIVEDANMYYSVNRGFESDGMKGGKALDKRLMKAWPPFQKAEAAFADQLYVSWISHQKDMVKKYERTGTEPTRARAAELIGRGAAVMREARRNPTSTAYNQAVEQYRLAYDDYRNHLSAKGAQLDGKFGPVSPHVMLKAPAKSLLENAQQYPKSIGHSLANKESNKLIKKAMPTAEVQFMTQAFHQMISSQNHMLAN